MRHCFNNCCENGKEVEYLDDDTMVVTEDDCHICHGTEKLKITVIVTAISHQPARVVLGQ